MRINTRVLSLAMPYVSGLLFGQSSLTVLQNGVPLGGNSVVVTYNTDRKDLSQFNGSPQMVEVRTTQPDSVLITPAGDWLTFAVVSATANNCNGASYSQFKQFPTTPFRICIAATQPSSAHLPGYYSGALSLISTSGFAVVPVGLNLFPTGYLQLTNPYPKQPFNGQTMAFTGGVLTSSAIHLSVYDTSTFNTPDDKNDLNQQLFVGTADSDGASIPWLVTTLTDVKTGLPTKQSPAILSIRIDPTLAPSGSQNVSGTILISSGTKYVGYDFVRVTATLPQIPVPQFVVPPSPITFTAGGATSQSFRLDSTGVPIAFQVTSDSPSWLSVAPLSGVTPQQLSITVTSSALSPGPHTGILSIVDTTGASSSQAVSVSITIPSPAQFSLRNSASYAIAIAPDSIAFGDTMGIATALIVTSNNPWPVILGGVHLDVTDSQGQTRAAPIYYVATNAMTFLLPAGTAQGSATAKLTTSVGSTVTGTFTVDRVAPGIFTMNANGSGVPAGIWIKVSAGGAQSFGYLFSQTQSTGSFVPLPMDLGVVGDQVFLSLYGTGFRNASQATATVGGIGVPVSGFAAVGLYQGEDLVNIGPLPQALTGRGEVALVLTFDGKAANSTTVNIR